MSDTEIRVWLCACLLLIIGLCAVVGYLLGIVQFLVERVGRTEDRVNEDGGGDLHPDKGLATDHGENRQFGGSGMTMENAQAIAETVFHWKRRAEDAEAEVERLREELADLRQRFAESIEARTK